MSRLEEVNETMKTIHDTITNLTDLGLNEKQITNTELACLITMLGDISISMAMIVDILAERSEDPTGCEEAKPYEE